MSMCWLPGSLLILGRLTSARLTWDYNIFPSFDLSVHRIIPLVGQTVKKKLVLVIFVVSPGFNLL